MMPCISGWSFSWCLHPPLAFLHTILHFAHRSASSLAITCLIFLHFTWIHTNVENKLSLKTKLSCGNGWHGNSSSNHNRTHWMTLIAKMKIGEIQIIYTERCISCPCHSLISLSVSLWSNINASPCFHVILAFCTPFVFDSIDSTICIAIKHLRLATAKNRQRQISFEQWMTEYNKHMRCACVCLCVIFCAHFSKR